MTVSVLERSILHRSVLIILPYQAALRVVQFEFLTKADLQPDLLVIEAPESSSEMIPIQRPTELYNKLKSAMRSLPEATDVGYETG